MKNFKEKWENYWYYHKTATILTIIFVLAAIGTMSLFGVRAAAAGADELATEASVDESISVIFYDGDELYYEANIESGGAPDLPEPPSREGYSFDGWRIGTASGEKYGAGTPLLTHTALYASNVLLPPSCEIISLSISYDGTSHRLSSPI